MIDSTGLHDVLRVNCFICSRTLMLSTYEPQYGHHGDEINSEKCITKESLFEVGPSPFSFSIVSGSISAESSPFKESKDPYNYRGFVIPVFGPYIGETIVVCSSCRAFTEGKTLQEILHARRLEKINSDVTSIYFSLYKAGLLLPYVENKNFGRMVFKIIWSPLLLPNYERILVRIEKIRSEIRVVSSSFSEKKLLEDGYVELKKDMDEAYSLVEDAIRMAKTKKEGVAPAS